MRMMRMMMMMMILFSNMRFIVMSVTAVCVLFLIKCFLILLTIKINGKNDVSTVRSKRRFLSSKDNENDNDNNNGTFTF